MLYNNLKKGIYIIHENKEWIPPFREAFNLAQKNGDISSDVILGEIILTNGAIDLNKSLEKINAGVFWSRLSASSHTRGNVFSKEYGRALLTYLESIDSNVIKVINGSNVLELEVSKIAQYVALNDYISKNHAPFRVPHTIAVFGKNDLLECAKGMKTPFITKHNQGGKGLGVKRFDSLESFSEYIDSKDFEMPVDGITLLQEYIKTREFFITRIEFIDSKFYYAVRVDTSGGSFELCPADACNIESKDNKIPEIAAAACDISNINKFSIRNDITQDTPIVKHLERFLKEHNISIAGIEFMESDNGELIVYDINTNTNYNSAVEHTLRQEGKKGAADKVIEFLYNKFKKLY